MRYNNMRLKITSLNKHSLGWWAKNAVHIGDNTFSCKNRTYLHDVYHDNSKDLVLMKARQTGATTYGLIKALWLAVAHGKNTSYFMPDQDWANRVSKVRLNDDIILYSPKIKCLIGKNNVNEVKSRKIGQGWIHFRGLVSASGTQETPADMVIFDEYDKVKDLKKVDEALSQLGESEYKWMLRMGLPSIPNYGIHKEFLTTDQRYWNVKCEHCNKFTILSEVFPKCVKRIGDYEVVRVCPHCGGSIDPLIGQYIAKEPKIERRRGYHFSRLNSVFANLDRILKWYDSGDNKATFQHEILGHAYTEAENRLSTAQIAACRRSTFNNEYTHLRNIMGVDTGKKLHVVILRGLPPVFSSLGGQKEPRYELITFKEVDTFQDVANLMEKYNIYCCVTDPQCSKERHAEAWSFIREHLGRVYGCYYTNSPKQLITVNKKQQVSVYRTGTLDKSHDSIVKQRLHIPQYDLYDPEFVEFSKHLCNLIKVVHSHDLTGEKKVKWINVGPDHYRHALNYAEIAYDIMYENRSGTWDDIEKLKNCRINTSCDFDLGYGLDI